MTKQTVTVEVDVPEGYETVGYGIGSILSGQTKPCSHVSTKVIPTYKVYLTWLKQRYRSFKC